MDDNNKMEQSYFFIHQAVEEPFFQTLCLEQWGQEEREKVVEIVSECLEYEIENCNSLSLRLLVVERIIL